ncbi:MAG: hypothetical protein HY314_04250 [Acidobacteria bacterium]|nr:hypothetical protein [Acidobacteriota bacterium]
MKKRYAFSNQSRRGKTRVLRRWVPFIVISFVLLQGFILPVPPSAAQDAVLGVPSFEDDAAFDSSSLSAVPEADGFVRYEEVDGTIVCRQATPEESLAMAERDPDFPLHTISPIRLYQQQTGLKIILRGTAQLNNFPDARAAFLRAAAAWEGLIKTPITVVIDVDFGTTRFGQPYPSGVLGSTSSQSIAFRSIYAEIRSRLIAGASTAQETSLYNSLPASTMPTDLGPTTDVMGASAVFRALDLLNPVANPDGERSQLGPPPSIGFNSTFKFDFDPSDGIDPDKIDFDAVAVHEIGHALGFTSNTGMRELLPSTPVRLTLWDLFRFRPGTTMSTLATAQRILSSGGEQMFFVAGPEVPLSTGRPDGSGGDGNQASHWKDDTLIRQYVGIMDPTLARGERETITNNDLIALDSFGYELKTAVSPIEELSTDDGTAEGGAMQDGVMVVNRLTPSKYPATLHTIRLFLTRFNGQPNPVGKQIRLIVFADPTNSGRPPNNPQRLVNQWVTIPSLPASGTFVSFNVQNGPTINSGDLYVGYQAPAPASGVGFPADSSGPQRQRGFFSTNNGMTFTGPLALADQQGNQTPVNMMIRAVVAY